MTKHDLQMGLGGLHVENGNFISDMELQSLSFFSILDFRNCKPSLLPINPINLASYFSKSILHLSPCLSYSKTYPCSLPHALVATCHIIPNITRIADILFGEPVGASTSDPIQHAYRPLPYNGIPIWCHSRACSGSQKPSLVLLTFFFSLTRNCG